MLNLVIKAKNYLVYKMSAIKANQVNRAKGKKQLQPWLSLLRSRRTLLWAISNLIPMPHTADTQNHAGDGSEDYW